MKNFLLFFLVAGTLLGSCTKQAIVDQDGSNPIELLDKRVSKLAKKTITVKVADYNQIFTIPCVNNGEGEQVSIVGTSELRTETTLSGFLTSTTMVFKIIQATGTGSVTGNLYTATGGFTTTILSSSKDSRYSYQYDEQVIVASPGSNNDLIYKLTASQNTGPKGEVIKEYKVVETNDCN